jgi:hypothetical protein
MHARAVLLRGDKLLRIGITLRSLPTLDGPGTYTEQLVRRLLQIDRKNEYLLIYLRQRMATSHAPAVRDYRNVQEVETGRQSG